MNNTHTHQCGWISYINFLLAPFLFDRHITMVTLTLDQWLDRSGHNRSVTLQKKRTKRENEERRERGGGEGEEREEERERRERSS